MASKLKEAKTPLSVDEELSRKLSHLDMSPVTELQVFYDELINEYPLALGKAVSKKNREVLQTQQQSLVYGETEFTTLGNVFEKIKTVYGRPNQGSSGPTGVLQSPGGIFYDLGSGTGKAVMAAAVLFPFVECSGVECLEGLHSVATDLLKTFIDKVKPKMPKRERDTTCQFFTGDFLDLGTKDWTDADVVFMNSTCYDDALVKKIAAIAVRLKKGSFFISLTKRLPCRDFTVLESQMQRMSWGEATVFIMQKITDSRKIAQGEVFEGEN